MKQKFSTAMAIMGPDIAALLFFSTIWIGLGLIFGAKLHLVEGSILFSCYMTILFLSIAAVSHCAKALRGAVEESYFRRARRILRDWCPLILLTLIYESLRDYTGIIRPDYIDGHLYELDLWLFGVEPVLWIQKFIHPFWTDYFSLMYGLYIALPITLAALLYNKRHFAAFREVALGVVICLYVGFLLYITFPAGPPRFYPGIQAYFQPSQLEGLFGLYEATHNLMNNSSYVIHRASFPSLHVALSALAVLQAYRFGHLILRRWLFGIYLYIAVGVWIATVYLRHHWTVDIMAGGILAVFSFVFARKIMAVWPMRDAARGTP